jgi:predicted ABC-type ATPase
MAPRMIVVAGPPGSGKSNLLPVRSFGVDGFNVDDRCRQLHGSYQGIPREIRRIASAECETFILDHIRQRVSFAVETTFRTPIATEQASAACAQGFTTFLFFVCTEDPAINIKRIFARSIGGGHAAPEDEIRTIYAASLVNLADALRVFDVVECFDSSVHKTGARHVARIHAGAVVSQLEPLPTWLQQCLDSLHTHPCSR